MVVTQPVRPTDKGGEERVARLGDGLAVLVLLGLQPVLDGLRGGLEHLGGVLRAIRKIDGVCGICRVTS
jgi:hypothetical protein